MPTDKKFHPLVSRWFTSHFTQSSPPQQKGWPVIAAGQHCLIFAPTGSGKTLAAFLWCINKLVCTALETEKNTFEKNHNGVHTLYISPLKALNNDIHYNLQTPLKGIRQTATEMGQDIPEIRTAVRTGDTPSNVRQAMIRKPPHILITTPESLYLLLTSVKGRLLFQNLQYVILDEIHAVCNNKRGVHLSLSLERLEGLCKNPPVRIGLSATQRPLERIASFLGGQSFSDKNSEPSPRPVKIVDCGYRRNMDVKVISPIQDFSDLPEATVWPAVIETLYKHITTHKTTLVFVNMRAQAEKIARQLNEHHFEMTGNKEEIIALAHHGSISRESRYEIENKLKNGKIPAVIATASLELGIDIGSIDLVINLEAPKTVSSALQRIGRSGHLLHSTSKGRIIPLYSSDIDDAVAITQSIYKNDIEETHIPQNCLDVLSQQISAETSMQPCSRPGLFHLVRSSYCYRDLSENVFNNILEMLTGKYAETELRALQPRLSWDKINDVLYAKRGTKLLSVMNGGTIADRAYYGVYLQEENRRLGDMEEEFVFESKPGDIFFLGNNEWQIKEIKQDRIIVTPRSSERPRAPFWKAEPAFQDYSTCIKTGRFRRKILPFLDSKETAFISGFHADQTVALNLYAYLNRQIKHTGVLPTDQQIVIEYFQDVTNEPHLVTHTTFGGKVNGAWATALAAIMEDQFNEQIQFTYDNDALLFRVPDKVSLQDIENLVHLPFSEIKIKLTHALTNSTLFSVRFRQNATRAFLLQRSRIGKRIPLWLQRLRSADLLQTVQKYPDFPILIETYRDCLQDVFDMVSLEKVIEGIHNNSIKITSIQTPSPSPMASGVLFRFLSQHMYEEDRLRTPGLAAEINDDMLAHVLSRESVPAMITEKQFKKSLDKWQFLAPEYKAKNPQELYDIIEKTGPIEAVELQQRSASDPELWLQTLQKQNRIHYIKTEFQGWVITEERNLYIAPFSPENIKSITQKHLRSHGPQTFEQITAALPLDKNLIKNALDTLHQDEKIVYGTLLKNSQDEHYCDRFNFGVLYRQSIAEQRHFAQPADRTVFYSFLLNRHQFYNKNENLFEIISRYAGYLAPLDFFEREIIGSRTQNRSNDDRLSELIKNGDIIITGDYNNQKELPGFKFFERGQGACFINKETLMQVVNTLDENTKTVFSFLQENGTSPVRDIVQGTSLTPLQIQFSLSQLVKKGLVSCDSFTTYKKILEYKPVTTRQSKSIESSWHKELNPARIGYHSNRRIARKNHPLLKESQLTLNGQWFTTTSFAVFGKLITETEQAEQQARILLKRYGILVKEFYRHEQGLLPWYKIFQALKKMEWSGEIKRGYFIKELGGIQFALPDALKMLEHIQEDVTITENAPLLISVCDPALPFGGYIPWNLKNKNQEHISVVKTANNHLLFFNNKPVVYLENQSSRIYTTEYFSDELVQITAQMIKQWLKLPFQLRPKNKIEILSIDNIPAGQSAWAPVFENEGYEISGHKLVLWPSKAVSE